jgi:hypothetical protein
VTVFYDVYLLCPARSADLVDRFLARFAPQREPAAAEYEVPRYAEAPAEIFPTAAGLVDYCVRHPTEPHGLYWRCLAGGDPAHAMVFFTADSGLIVGLSVAREPDRWLGELQVAMESAVGWIGLEQPPPDTARAFLALAAGQAEAGASAEAPCSSRL